MATRQRKEAVDDAVHSESSGAVPAVEPTILNTVAEIKPLDNAIEVTVSTSFQVNLGNFENKNTFTSAKARFAADADPEGVAEYLWDRVYATVAPELEQAANLTVHKSQVRGDKEGTFIHLIMAD